MALPRIETVRARLTLWYVSVLAVILLLVSGLTYVLLARALHARIDDNLHAVLQIAATSLANDLAEGQDTEDAARSTAAELATARQLIAIYDGTGRRLAWQGPHDRIAFTLPPPSAIPAGDALLMTVTEADDRDDRHRLALRQVTISPSRTTYLVVVGQSLESSDDELESLREVLWYVVPIGLIVAGFGGWFLARRSLEPVVAMAEQQRQFMADASHELRTPVATARTAAGVALQQPRRDEREYREALEIIEGQTTRLSRIVDDMFTLARVDAGNYPIQQNAMYLDEVLEEVARGSRVMAAARGITVETRALSSATFTGDEELIRRLLGNLIDNAIRYAGAQSTVRAELDRTGDRYVVTVSDQGPGIAAEVQPHIFERFYRGDGATAPGHARGAGLGLALARWVARIHGGDVRLTQSSARGSTFTVELPAFISRSSADR